MNSHFPMLNWSRLIHILENLYYNKLAEDALDVNDGLVVGLSPGRNSLLEILNAGRSSIFIELKQDSRTKKKQNILSEASNSGQNSL